MMLRLALITALGLAAGSASALTITPFDRHDETSPSGQLTLVLRYIAPDLAGLDYGDVAADLDALCTRDGLPAWVDADPRPDEIVIVLMDRPIPRGQPDPAATQYISAYVTETGEHCIWQ